MALSPFDLARTRQQAPRPVLVRPRSARPLSPRALSPAFQQSAERRVAQADEAPRSFLGQLKDTFTNVIPGVVSLAKTAGQSALGPVRMGIDLVQGDLSPTDVIDAAWSRPWDLEGDEQAAEFYDRYAPLQRQMFESFGETAGNVTNPSRYLQASDEGRILDVVLNDVGNVALAGGITSKVLSGGAATAAAAGRPAAAARMGRIARGAERVSTLGNTIADAPFTAPLSVPRRALTAGRKAMIRRAEGTSLAARYPGMFTAEGRFLLGASRGAERQARRAQTKVQRSLLRGANDVGADLVDQGVATAVRIGLADQLDNLVRQGVDPEQARQMLVTRDRPEQSMTPEIATAALEYLNGTMDPERSARIAAYSNVVDEVIGQGTERALAGAGRPGGALDPRQLGNDPLWDRVDEVLRMEGTGKGLDPATNMPADPADMTLFEQVLDSPEVYPAPWRPAIRSAGLARAGLADMGADLDVPLRPQQMLDAGMPAPRYLPGGRSQAADPTATGTGRTPIREGIRGLQGVTSERLRASSEFQPFSARTIAEKAGAEARSTVMNERIVEMFNDPTIRTVSDVIPEQRRRELLDAANREAAAQRGTPGQQAQRAKELYGLYVAEELRDVYGHDVIMGSRTDTQVGDFDPNAKAVYDRIGDDSVVLPAGLKDRLVPYMRGKDMGKFFNALAKINSKFKGAVLPFSIRWQLGDIVGNYFMAWVGGGIDPARLTAAMRQLRNLDEDAVRAIFDDLQDSGLNLEEARWMRGEADLPTPTTRLGKAWRRGGDFRRASFRLNEAINRLGRQGYALAKLQDLMAERGLSFDDALGTGGWDAPEVQRAITDAVSDANEVLGTFDEMTPFERNYMRNIFPFFAWNRHITLLAWRTAIDNPARMMWTMRLGSYGAEQNDGTELLPWQAGSIAAGDALIPTNFVNPFNDIGGGSIFTPTGAARSLSPGLKVLAAAVGKDANRGFADLTRAYDGQGLDELGRPGGFRLLSPSELAYQVVRQVPQGRALLNVLPTGEVGNVGLGPHPRYGSGEFMVDRWGRPIDTDSRWQSLFGLAGVAGSGDMPLLGSTQDNADILAARDRRIAEARRRAANTVRFGGD